MRKRPRFIIAIIVAAGAFWVNIPTRPPKTEAAQPLASININNTMMQEGLSIAEPADAF